MSDTKQEREAPTFTTLSIDGPLPGRRRLVRPITVVIEYDEEEVVVSEPEFHMHASAPTEEEALIAFRRIFSGYLDSLARREKTLGPPLRDQLNYLRFVIASEEFRWPHLNQTKLKRPIRSKLKVEREDSGEA